MTNPQLKRGNRAELEVAAIISDLLGITVRRKPAAREAVAAIVLMRVEHV